VAADVLESVTRALAAAGCVAADEEAAELVAASASPADLEALVARRSAGEPLAWLVGRTRFCDIEVLVDPDVYVPRWQSEALALRAAALLPHDGTGVDLATGSGAVAAVLRDRRPAATVLATDIDPVAVACARRNAVDARLGSLDDPLPADLVGRVDVLCAVLPYVPTDALHLLPRDVVAHEPVTALDGGTDGLRLVADVVARSTRWVRPDGWLLLEVGTDQIDVVTARFRAAGYAEIEALIDGDGDPRGVVGRRSGRPEVGAQASSR
jgi:release factor glutamine methyltransferase